MPINTSDNLFGVAKWIVDPTAGAGTHTTITAALTAASAGQTIFIRPGTYTENLTLKAGVDLAAFICNSSTPTVIISGRCTATFAGACSISGVQLKTNGDYLLAVTGSSATIVNLINCYINCLNATGILYSSSSSSSQIMLSKCLCFIGTTGISLYSMTSTGTLNIYYLDYDNTGSSTTLSSNSAGNVFFYYCDFPGMVSTSSTGSITAGYTNFGTTSLNTIAVTTAGTGASAFRYCRFNSGTSSAISVGSGTTVSTFNCSIDSSNTNAITGAGAFKGGPITFIGTGIGNNASTITDSSFGRKGTWTPIVTFNNSSTGITYGVSPTGSFWCVGNIVFFELSFTLTSNGSGVGEFRVTGPFTNSSKSMKCNVTVTLGASIMIGTGTYLVANYEGSANTISIGCYGNSGFTGNLGNTNITDSCTVNISGFFWRV